MDNSIPYPTIGLSQIIVLVAFLAALGLVWLYVQRNKDGLARRVGQGRRIKVAETMALSPTSRAVILAVDGREFLVLNSRGSAPVVTPLTGEQS